MTYEELIQLRHTIMRYRAWLTEREITSTVENFYFELLSDINNYKRTGKFQKEPK